MIFFTYLTELFESFSIYLNVSQRQEQLKIFHLSAVVIIKKALSVHNIF